VTSPYDASTVSVITSGGDAIPTQDYRDARFACRITGSQGWINLDDHERYIVTADSFANSQTTWRRTQVQGPYVAGKFTVSAVPDQVTENVGVYVLGVSQADLQQNLADLIDAVSQPYFQLLWSMDEASYTWDCDTADYSIEYTTATLFARQLTVKLQIPRNPLVTMGVAW
jgi:hypothetical protein